MPRFHRGVIGPLLTRALFVTALFVTALFVTSLSVALAPPASAAVAFRPPSDAAILDPFRLPDGPYGAGNRGVEYATVPGDRIVAAADGTVAFAGAVAGSLFVSIDHPGGLRSTYGYVANMVVRPGSRVRGGDLVALAGGPFHFTVRRDGRYVDPVPLFGVRREHVRLVPHPREDARHRENEASPAGPATEPATLSGGPFGPRLLPDRQHRILIVRATPGRFGVLHDLLTGKKERPWQSSP